LHKRHNVIDGKGYQCKVSNITLYTTTGFWGDRSFHSVTQNVPLTREDCAAMVYTKSCFGKRLVCEEGACSLNVEPTRGSGWWSTEVTHGLFCAIVPRAIIGESENSILFTATNHVCKVNNFYCLLHDSIIIWDEDVIHSCPYDIVKLATFVDTDDHLFISKEDNLLF